MMSAGYTPSSEPLETMIDTFSIGSLMGTFLFDRMPLARLDAATRLGNSGDLGSCLGWTLRKQLVELLDRDARGLCRGPERSGRFPSLCTRPRMNLNDLPVVLGKHVDALCLGDLRCHGFGPLARVLEEALIVDLNCCAAIDGAGHGRLLCR